MINYLLIVLNVFLITAAQLFMKYGADAITHSQIPLKNGLISVLAKISNPYIILGGIAYVSSFLLWIYILTKNPISFVYPIMSLSYITVMVFSIFLFRESVVIYQWIGVFLIISGTFLIFLKHQS